MPRFRSFSKRTFVVAVVAGLAVVGGGAALATDDVNPFRESGRLEEGGDLVSEASITPEQAVATAQGVADGRVDDVELDYEGGRLVYEVEVGNADVVVDATDGSVISTNGDDDAHEGRDDDDNVALPDGSISYDQAVEIARQEADGVVDDVEVERRGDRVVYSVEVGNHEVTVDALNGSVISSELDD
jgi:uncharacterized membrane protein YkoI